MMPPKPASRTARFIISGQFIYAKTHNTLTAQNIWQDEFMVK